MGAPDFAGQVAEGVHCLIVDDHIALRTALQSALRGFGHECLAVESGDEALDLLGTCDVDVMITDIHMPGMDGLVLLERARRAYPDVAIIMVTGVADMETAVSCLRHGAHDYIVKPVQMEEVNARVLQAAEKRRLRLENRRYQHHLAELVQHQALRIEELFVEGIQTIVHALEAKDKYTQGHSARVAAYAGATARRLGYDEDDVQILELGAELHDVGKIGVSEAVLNKRDKLTDEEYLHIMEHTLIGSRILAPLMSNVPAALEIVRSHHERLDGTGLPDGLAGDQIPVFARIVSVVDAFDAMTTERSYRPGLGTAAALTELEAKKGTQFDPEIVDAFLSAFGEMGALPTVAPKPAWRRLPRVVGAGIAVSTAV